MPYSKNMPYLDYDVPLGPQRHSAFNYPAVTLRRGAPPPQPVDSTGIGFVSVSTGSSTADTVLKWGFWIGMGFVAHRLYRVARYDEPFIQWGGETPAAWEMNPRRRDERLFQEALRLYVPGEPVVPLAQELGVSKCTIINWMKDAGIYRPAPRGGSGSSRDEQLYQKAKNLYVPGEPVGPLARELGVSASTIINWMKDAGVYESAPRGPSRDEHLFQEALRLYVPGEPVGPLAQELGVSKMTIIRWMKQAGVYAPASRARKKKKNPEPYAFGGW